jgi:hypothetical protein
VAPRTVAEAIREGRRLGLTAARKTGLDVADPHSAASSMPEQNLPFRLNSPGTESAGAAAPAGRAAGR